MACFDNFFMDLRQLRYFLHVAKTQNLTQASSKAWVSQSALSRQISLLEAELGVTLFERHARGVKLTEAGAVLVRRAEVLLQEVDDLKRDIASTKHEPTGTLRIGTPTSLRALVMVPFFIQYHRLYPDVLLIHTHGTAKSLRDALAEGELDIAITANQEVLDPFAVEPLISEALCLVGPPQARLQADKLVGLKRITEHPLILTSYPNSLRVFVDRALTKIGQQTQPIIEADTAYMMLDLIHSGMCYTVLPYSGVHDAIKDRYISASPIKALRFEWVIARSRERAQTVAAQRAIELLREICKAKVVSREWLTARLAESKR
jgi:LysR family transcriptional regulator, nitrogen assimilation regulatory protein